MDTTDVPIPMLLFCPSCGGQHNDDPNPAKNWTNPPHRSHKCQFCDWIWRPADVPTTGVLSLSTRGERDQSPIPSTATAREILTRLTSPCFGFPGCGECADGVFGDVRKCACARAELQVLINQARPITTGGPDRMQMVLKAANGLLMTMERNTKGYWVCAPDPSAPEGPRAVDEALDRLYEALTGSTLTSSP